MLVPSLSEIVRLRRVNVPFAFVGLAYFIALASWFGLTRGSRLKHPRSDRLLLHVAGVAGAASVVMIGLMIVRVAPWCRGCMVVHAINFGVLLAVRTLRATPGERPLLARRDALSALAVMFVLLAAVSGLYHQHRTHRRAMETLLPSAALVAELRSDRDFLVREHSARPQHVFAPRPTERSLGDHAELMVFTDFRCPACACNATWLRDQAPRHFGGTLAVRVRYARAGDAARFAEAARHVGGETAFEHVHERLFENAHDLGPDLYRRLAAEIGIDAVLLLRAMDSPPVRAAVEADVALAKRLGVTTTPTMFLDGRRIPEICDTALFWRTAGAKRTDSPGRRVARGDEPVSTRR